MKDGEPTARLADHPRMPEIGQAIAGRYEVLRCLGAGTLGVVYLANDLQSDEKLAVKVLAPETSDQPALVDRIWKALGVVRELTHRNTVQIRDLGKTESGCLFLAMEYVEGEDLDSLIRRKGGLSPERALRIGEQILLSLAEAHRLGLVHGDLEPGNVMVSRLDEEADRVKVADFGLARAISPELSMVATRPGHLTRRPAYAAPELVRGQPITPASDVYAVGLLVIEMVTGHRAVPGESPTEWRDSQLAPQPVAVPPQLEGRPIGRVLAQAVAKGPSARYGDADEMLEALLEESRKPDLDRPDLDRPKDSQRASQPDAGSAQRPGSRMGAGRGAAPVGRPRTVPVVLGTVALAGAVVAVLMLRGEDESPPPLIEAAAVEEEVSAPAAEVPEEVVPEATGEAVDSEPTEPAETSEEIEAVDSEPAEPVAASEEAEPPRRERTADRERRRRERPPDPPPEPSPVPSEPDPAEPEPPPEAPPEPVPDLPTGLSGEQINQIMRSSLSDAGECRPVGVAAGVTVEVPVDVEVVSDGSVRAVDAGDHPAAACIERLVRGLRFPPFTRRSQRFRYRYLLR